MEGLETPLDVSRVRAAWVRVLFERVKAFRRLEQLVAIAEHGAPAQVVRSTDVHAALAYLNHAPHIDSIIANMSDDVRFGRGFGFPAQRSSPHSQHEVVFACRGCIYGWNSEYPRRDDLGVPAQNVCGH